MLQCQIASLGYERKEVLHDVSFGLERGEFVAVIGRNGSGKSTLLHTVCGLLPCRGSVRLDGQDLLSLSPRERARRVALMQQQPALPHIKVRELVAMGRSPYQSLNGTSTPDCARAIAAALHDAELTDLADAYLDCLSGGEARRAYLGMMLSQNTPLMLLDEVTAFMDADHEHRFFGLLKSLCRDREKTVLAATHSLSCAMQYADRLIVVCDGTIGFVGTPNELLDTDIPVRVFGMQPVVLYDDGGRKRIFFHPLGE